MQKNEHQKPWLFSSATLHACGDALPRCGENAVALISMILARMLATVAGSASARLECSVMSAVRL